MKVSTNVHSDEVENNHKEAQIKCQKSINQIFCIPLQLSCYKNSYIYTDVLANK